MDEFDFGMVSAVASRQAAKLVLLSCEQEEDGNKMVAHIKLEKEMQDIEKSVRGSVLTRSKIVNRALCLT